MRRGLCRKAFLLAISLSLLALSVGSHTAGMTAVTTAPPAAVAITLGSAPASLAVGQTYQFSVAVANTANSGATWAAGGVTGGNATVGTITSTGLYTAPRTVPTPQTVTITAASQADNTKSASLTVTITQAGGGNSTPISVPGNQSKTTGINFSLTSVTPTLYINQIGTCSGTPASPESCGWSVAPVQASAAGSTITVILLGHGFTSGGNSPTLNSNLKVNVSTGNSTDATVSNVTAEADISGANVILFSVQVSAGAAPGPRAIIVKDSSTGEQQTYLGGFIIGP